jgi:hypothetical protein
MGKVNYLKVIIVKLKTSTDQKETTVIFHRPGFSWVPWNIRLKPLASNVITFLILFLQKKADVHDIVM